MAKMLNKYRLIVNRAKMYVIHAFDACDLDGNKVCNLEEFLLLNRHIERNTYDYKNVCKIFLENTDVCDSSLLSSWWRMGSSACRSISSRLCAWRRTSSRSRCKIPSSASSIRKKLNPSSIPFNKSGITLMRIIWINLGTSLASRRMTEISGSKSSRSWISGSTSTTTPTMSRYISCI